LGNEKITKIEALINGKAVSVQTLEGGDIGIVYGLDELKISHVIGNIEEMGDWTLGKPTLKTRIAPVKEAQRIQLINGINRIAEGDPFLEYELDEIQGHIYLNLFGEIQMEIIKDILANQYNVEVEYHDQLVIYKEAPVDVGEAASILFGSDNPYYAGIGFRVEANERGKGIEYKSLISIGNLPRSFQHGIEDGVFETLKQGLKGWEMTDIKIFLTYGRFNSVSSTPSEFRNLAPMVLMEAVDKARTKLLWPICAFELRVPQETVGRAVSDLLKMMGRFEEPEVSNNFCIIKGTLPIELSRNYERDVASYTGGKGVMMTRFLKYDDAPPSVDKEREKVRIDPLNKGLYMLSKRQVL